jgi:hypothetical protein
MADKWPLANGNWSDAANWNDGTLPTASDDVFADGKTVVIDQNVTVLSIRSTQRSGGINGGTFQVTSSGFTINCTGLGMISGSSGSALTGLLTSGVLTVNSNAQGGGANTRCISILNPGGTYNIFGTMLGGAFGLSSAILVNANSTVNIVGNILGGTGPSAFGIELAQQCTLNVTGNVTGNGNNAGIGAGNSVVNIIGTVTSSTLTGGVTGLVNSVITTAGSLINNNGRIAIQTSGKLYLDSSTVNEWTFQNSLLTNTTLYEPGVNLGNPLESDVRDGVTYASGALTGSLAVPPSGSVALGVPVDDGVGTAMISITDMGALLASYIV